MALHVRRVITGHDSNGRAVVKIDEVAKHLVSGRPGATACNIWTTEGFPVNNDGSADEGLRKAGTTLENGTILIPGVISHTTNLVEHPELIAERIVRYAKIVGRENVIAGADCGFAASGIRFNDVHPSVVWLKFAAMAEGSRLATRQLWGRA